MTAKDGAIKPERGAKQRFGGSVLLFVGFLDAAMALKTGEGAGWFDYALIACGALLLVAGAWAGSRRG